MVPPEREASPKKRSKGRAAPRAREKNQKIHAPPHSLCRVCFPALSALPCPVRPPTHQVRCLIVMHLPPLLRWGGVAGPPIRAVGPSQPKRGKRRCRTFASPGTGAPLPPAAPPVPAACHQPCRPPNGGGIGAGVPGAGRGRGRGKKQKKRALTGAAFRPTPHASFSCPQDVHQDRDPAGGTGCGVCVARPAAG